MSSMTKMVDKVREMLINFEKKVPSMAERKKSF